MQTFFSITLIPPFRVSEFIFEKRYKVTVGLRLSGLWNKKRFLPAHSRRNLLMNTG